jgi:serine/threonine protein kinase
MEGIKSYFRCMFRALRDIHARGVIHRDVKPANFLFDPRTGIGTLCDFGLACVSRPGYLAVHPRVIDSSHSAWRAPVAQWVRVCTRHLRGVIRTDDFDPRQNSTLSTSRGCRGKRDTGARGQATESVTWTRTHGTRWGERHP